MNGNGEVQSGVDSTPPFVGKGDMYLLMFAQQISGRMPKHLGVFVFLGWKRE